MIRAWLIFCLIQIYSFFNVKQVGKYKYRSKYPVKGRSE